MEIVYAGEEMPAKVSKSLFLAGPTPRNRNEVESWRPDALQILNDIGYDGTVFVPELRQVKKGHDYDTQVEWEEEMLNAADCIVFWVPRDISPDTTGYPKMAAFTTNVEWGAWSDSGKVVFGYPEGADKISYLKYYADKYNVPISTTLTDTLRNAIELIGEGHERTEGERYVPNFIWKLDSFQSWHKAQTNAGNSLKGARLLYTFRPGRKDFVFLWILKVDVWIESEQRNKTNEFVLARPDISSVMLWAPSKTDLLDSEIVLVKEFRSPASTEDGFIRELVGGSSVKPGIDPTTIAAEEIHEETGFELDPARMEFQGARQLAGTLSSHKSHLFVVELTNEEMEWFKSQEGIAKGNIEDTEQTYSEVYTIKDILKNNNVDWATLGQILSIINK